MRKGFLILLAMVITAGVGLGAGFEKKVTFPTKTMTPVTFDHGKHLKQKGIECKTCHPGIFKMKAGTSKVTMADINKGKFCGVCHRETARAFPVKGNCARCHVPKKVV